MFKGRVDGQPDEGGFCRARKGEHEGRTGVIDRIETVDTNTGLPSRVVVVESLSGVMFAVDYDDLESHRGVRA